MGGGGGGGVYDSQAWCFRIVVWTVFTHVQVLRINPPRNAVAENLGTFMPNCCFSLIFISYIYTSFTLSRGDVFVWCLFNEALVTLAGQNNSAALDISFSTLQNLFVMEREGAGMGRHELYLTLYCHHPNACASSWTVSNASHTATTKIILH